MKNIFLLLVFVLVLEAGVLGFIIFNDLQDNPEEVKDNSSETEKTTRAPGAYDGCVISGCSGQVCGEKEHITTCEYSPEYACYQQEGICERNNQGTCSWRDTSALNSCIEEKTAESNNTDNQRTENDEVSEENVVLHDVPFTTQAPFGNWEDARQEDGCEEAAALMAVRWARNEPLSLSEAEDEIIAISEWQKENYGEFRDVSAEDTYNRILKGYFNINNADLRFGVSVEDIKRELYNGNVVIGHFNGQILNNPYYSPPGPSYHALVIKGYDPSTNEFITNDNGTKRGEGFRYSANTIRNALSDYETGYKEPREEIRKSMIVVRPTAR